jgi:membrane protein YqaA with SNARE-associated domain
MVNKLSERFPRARFFLVNLLKGLIWLSLIIGAYVLFMELVYKDNPEYWIEKFYSKPLQIYGIYIFSEFCFGLLPPEIFMIWALHKGSVLHYVLNIVFFVGVSYAAGVTAFLLGKYLQRVLYYRYLQRKFFSRYLPLVRKYGLFLIIVAAATPLPYSATSLVVGASGFSFRMYLLAALSRVARYAIYGYIIYQTHNF